MNNTISINKETLTETVNQLNNILSNYQIYYQNLRNFHWNIRGKHFFDLHQKFEELYNEAKVSIDEIAERILTLGERPLSQLKSYLETADIKEKSITESSEMVRAIVGDHTILINNMRQLIKIASEAGDEGTVDLITTYLASLEKHSWMLNAWVNN